MRRITRLESLIENRIMYQELYFVSFIVFFFFLDTFFIQIFSQQCLYFLYIFSLAMIPKKYSWFLTFFIFLLLAAESIVVHTTLGPDFFAAFLSYLFALYILDLTAFKKWFLALTLFIFLVLTSYNTILSCKISSIYNPCTSLKFIGNFIVLYFSLKWLSAVKRGNRF